MLRLLSRILAATLPVILLGCPGDDRPPTDPSGVYLSMVGVTRDPALLVRGLIERDANAEIFLDPDCRDTVVAAGGSDVFASRGLQIILPPNTSSIVAVRARRGKLTSMCVVAATITHDDVAPDAPKLSGVQVASVEPLRVAMSGTAEAASRLRLYFQGGCTGESADATVEGNGTFRVEVPVEANATTIFSAHATDGAGNTSGCSQNFTFTHDDQPPPAPRLNAINPALGTRTQITVTGTAERDAQVRLYRDPACGQSLSASAATAASNGSFSLMVNVGQNQTTQIFGRATDLAGNVSACSAPVTYTHDSVPPSPPVLGPSSPASPSTQLAFELDIQAEPHSRVQLFAAAACQGTPLLEGTMGAGGLAIADLTGLPNATRTFSARAIDVAGNTSGCSANFLYTHDDIPPAAPLLSGTIPALVGNTTMPQVEGTTEPYARVQIYRTANCTGSISGTATANGAGTFVSTTFTAYSNATTTLSARAMDATGNVSPCSSNVLTYRHDSIAPSAPILVGTWPPSPSRSTAVQVLGMGEPGATAQVFSSSICSASALLASGTVGPEPSGSFSGRGPFELSITAPANTNTPLAVSVRDEAGNSSSCISLSGGFTHDATRGWHDVSALEAPGVEGHSPGLVVTPAGATAVWARLDGTTASTIVSADWTGGAWTAPQTVAPTGTHLLGPVRLAADSAGNVYAVFSRYGAGPAFSGESFGTRRTAGGAWEAPVSFGAETYEPDVAAGATGEVIGVFRANVSPTESQIHARRFSGGLWDAPVRLDGTAQSDFAPRVTVTTTGEGVVLYTVNQGTMASPADELWSVRFSGGNWQAPQRRSGSTGRVIRGDYAIASGSSGRAVAAWLETSTTTSTTYRFTTTRYSTTGFNTSNTVVGSSSNMRGVALSVNGLDTAMLLGTNQVSDQVQWSRSAGHTTSGSGFSTSLSALSSPAALGAPVRVTSANDGAVYAAWIGPDRMDTGRSALWFSSYLTLGGWSAPQLIEREIDPLDTFDLGVNNGRVVVVWSHTDGNATRSVRARVLD